MKALTKITLPVLFLFIVSGAFSQGEVAFNTKGIEKPESNQPKARLMAEAPSFKGGIEKLNRFMSKHLQYPEMAKRYGIEKTVIVEFYISKTGELDDIKIFRAAGFGLDEEAIRVIHEMPAWNPAMQNGQSKRVKYRLPVKFELTN
jgi:protein TonB